MFRAKRVYDPPEPADGCRVLIDRLWPRGLSKEAAAVDTWLKDIAPSTELRQWFGHDAARWDAFAARYRQELTSPERVAALDALRDLGRANQMVTLLFATRDERQSHAVLLIEALDGG